MTESSKPMSKPEAVTERERFQNNTTGEMPPKCSKHNRQLQLRGVGAFVNLPAQPVTWFCPECESVERWRNPDSAEYFFTHNRTPEEVAYAFDDAQREHIFKFAEAYAQHVTASRDAELRERPFKQPTAPLNSDLYVRQMAAAHAEHNDGIVLSEGTLNAIQNSAIAAIGKAKDDKDAELRELREQLAKCGKENCMGHDTEGCVRWVREARLQVVERQRDELRELRDWAARVILQHLNDEDYEASLAGIYAKLTEHTL